jgi:hypothetical protein
LGCAVLTSRGLDTAPVPKGPCSVAWCRGVLRSLGVPLWCREVGVCEDAGGEAWSVVGDIDRL